MKTMDKRTWMRGVAAAMLVAGSPWALAQTTPDALIKQVSTEVLDAVKADKTIQAGDVKRITALVDAKIMPHVDFEGMTRFVMGQYARQSTPEQRQQLQVEFKQVLVRTYSGAFSMVKDQNLEFEPQRPSADPAQAEVRSKIVGGGAEPIQLLYRLRKVGEAWKVYDVNVGGSWLAQNYRTQYTQEIGKSGIDGLIKLLADRNKSAAGAKS
jgi:phospholipid transport system substrate-binding protein